MAPVLRAFRRAAFLACVVLVSIAGASAGADRWISLDGSGAAPARVDVVRPAPDRVEARVVVPGILAGSVATERGARGVIEIPGGDLAAALGQPRVPVLRYMLEVPRGATVNATLVPLDRRTFRLSQLGLPGALLPVQPPVPKIAGASAPYVEDAKAYLAAGWQPRDTVAVVDRAVLRGREIALVEVRPVRYDPVRRAVEIVREATLLVTVTGGSEAQARRDAGRLRSWENDRAIAPLLLAPAPAETPAAVAGTGGGAAEGAEGLLVIVNDAFEAAVQPLVDWKRKTGYKVEVVRTSALGTPLNDTAVKNAIQARYNGWSNPSLGFVLLVGDTDFCPIHNGNGGGSSQVTDNWYACLDGPDYLPDLAIARISTRSAAETQAVVDKLVPYEKATFATTAWVKKAGFIGTADSSHYGLIEGTHDFCIDTYTTPNGYQQTAWSHGKPSSDRHYYTFNADTSEISASINEGRSIINYSGHGATDGWAGPTSHGGYYEPDVRANTNDGMYPFVVSNACITNSLAETECFGETWQKAPHKGAIGFWGASNNSYWDEDDYLQRQLWSYMFPMDATPALGVLVNKAKMGLYLHYGDVGNVRYYFDMYNLLSEPTLSIWTRVPRTMNVTYPASLPIGDSQFPVTVTDGGQPVAGALVAVRKTDENVFESAYTDATGAVTLTLAPAPANPGQLEITVTKHDYRPFEGTSEVISPDSAWLVHRSHVVDDTAGGDGDAHANPGETIVMPITVENVGQVPGTGLAGTLSTSTPQWVAIEDAAVTFPDLAPNALGTSLPDHVRVRVLPEAPDNALLGFDLHWTAAGGANGTTSFTEPVLAVDFEYQGQAIDDSAGGNGNGVAGPGETVDMTLTIGNVGHRDSTGIHGVLSSASPYVTILQAEASFPDLAAGASGASTPPPFRFRVAQDAPDKQPVAFTLRLTDARGYEEVVPFDVMVSTCATTVATDVPKPIADNSTVTSALTLDRSVRINEVNVYVDIAHTYIGDLKVIVYSPAGTSVLLHNRTGSSADNLRTWYDTETQPAEPLSRFNGEDARGTWTLEVRDEAGGDTGSLDGWKLEICGEAIAAGPTLSVAGHSVDDAGTCDPDGVADVGETATFRVRVTNTGTGPANDVRASLASTARVSVLDGPVPLGTIGVGQQAEASFRVAIGAVGCMEDAPFTVRLTSAEGEWSDGFSERLETDLSDVPTTEDLEHGGAAPPGWTHSANAGTDDWAVRNTKNHTPAGAYSWFVSDVPTTKDDMLYTPSYTVGPTSTLTFWHFMNSHVGHDGGVVEISNNGGTTWADVGAHITTGGYDQAMTAGPLSGRTAWTGKYTEWKQVVVDLSSWAGQTVKFRFRYACDETWAVTGWWVDDITVTTRGEVCDEHPCGVPGEARITSVTKDGAATVLGWAYDPLAVRYQVLRSPDPTRASSFADVTSEDPDATDTTFRDNSGGSFQSWIVVEEGPDGVGPWGHFGL